MTEVLLQLELCSAATFGRGDGVAGLVDSEVEHDRDGFPVLRGRTLKGLLAEAAEDLVYALQLQGVEWERHKSALFGQPGSSLKTHGILHVGDAMLPQRLRVLILHEREEAARRGQDSMRKEEVLAAFTGIRRQTAMNRFGGPEHDTLHSLRVVLRGTLFESVLTFEREPVEDEWTVLAGAVLGLRAAGTGRNRGRGRLRAILKDEEFTRQYLSRLMS